MVNGAQRALLRNEKSNTRVDKGRKMISKRKIGSNQDKEVRRQTGWRIEVNSGATDGRKGDLKAEELLIETKSPEYPQKSFKLFEEWFDKVAKQAFSMGKRLGIIVFTFNQRDQYAALPLRDFDNLHKSNIEYQKQISDLQEEIKNLKQQLEGIVNEDKSKSIGNNDKSIFPTG
jgi:hypothetical protein